MKDFHVGDLVKDILNREGNAYGLGIIVGIADGEESDETFHPELVPLHLKYDVYFTKFERIITFHGDYLEKV